MRHWLGIILATFLATSTLVGEQPSAQSEQGALFLQIQSLTPAQHDLYRQLADQLRCPTCTGLSIMQSDAPFSMTLKKVLVDEIKMGKNYDEIIAHFTARYGLWILREPPKSGFHLIAWLLPLSFAVLAAAVMVWLFFIKKKKGRV